MDSLVYGLSAKRKGKFTTLLEDAILGRIKDRKRDWDIR